MLAYISFENKEFSSQVIKDLLAKIEAADFDELNSLRRPLLQMALLEDENFMERVKKIISTLLECLR
jgi:hypothetical protein